MTETTTTTPGGAGSIADIAGVKIGHYQRLGRGWMTGTTVVLTPSGATAGVDVRGGAPGTRETDLLRPENLVQKVHAICLTGGSAFGLAAADGVMQWLAQRSIGFPIGTLPHEVVPIVPAAVIFDLGRGGSWANRPTAEFGFRAAQRAGAQLRRNSTSRIVEGTLGAGTGARSGGIKGGYGTASRRLSDGTMVGAAAVVNSIGSVLDRGTGLPHHTCAGLELRRPSAADRAALRSWSAQPSLPLNTTIGVVATNATLTPSETTKLAQVAHDGLARAVRPAHLMNDGDTVFSMATAMISDDRDAKAQLSWFNGLLAAAADVFAEAITRGVLLATGSHGIPSYRELCPTAWPAGTGEGPI